MTPNSAYSLVPIVVGTDYTPSAEYENHVDPNVGVTSPAGPTVLKGYTPPIYGLLCTVSNTGPVEIQALGDSSSTTFPAGTFKQGVVYYIYLAKLVADGSGSFVGFRYAQTPQIL